MRKLTSTICALALLLSQAAHAQLMVNELNGFNAGGATPATVSFEGCTTNINNLTTYTFNNVAIGTAASDRIVVVGVSAEDGATVFNTSSMTIGGNAATERVDTAAASTTFTTSIYNLLVTSGTTATVAVTMTEAVEALNICVWAVYGLASAVPLSTDSFSGTGSATLSTTGDGGVIIGSAAHSGIAGNSVVWEVPPLTSRADATSAEMAYGAADMTTTGASVTINGTGSNAGLQAFIALR